MVTSSFFTDTKGPDAKYSTKTPNSSLANCDYKQFITLIQQHIYHASLHITTQDRTLSTFVILAVCGTCAPFITIIYSQA